MVLAEWQTLQILIRLFLFGTRVPLSQCVLHNIEFMRLHRIAKLQLRLYLGEYFSYLSAEKKIVGTH